MDHTAHTKQGSVSAMVKSFGTEREAQEFLAKQPNNRRAEMFYPSIRKPEYRVHVQFLGLKTDHSGYRGKN